MYTPSAKCFGHPPKCASGILSRPYATFTSADFVGHPRNSREGPDALRYYACPCKQPSHFAFFSSCSGFGRCNGSVAVSSCQLQQPPAGQTKCGRISEEALRFRLSKCFFRFERGIFYGEVGDRNGQNWPRRHNPRPSIAEVASRALRVAYFGTSLSSPLPQ